MNQLPEEKTLTQYVKFEGGLDLQTPVLTINPGAALDAMNYQPGLFGGYERMDACERSDGRAAPSDAAYYYATYTFAATVLVGQSVTGNTSLATGVVAQVSATAIVLTKVVGTFVNAETFSTSATGGGGLPLLLTMTYSPATVIGTFTSAPLLNGYPDALSDAIATNNAASIYRTDVSAVPGSGPVRGVQLYRGIVYAFRDSADGTTGGMWKQTATGWVSIPLYEEIYFTAADTTLLDGIVITQGTASATVARVVQTTSATSPNRVGRLILTGRTGNFYTGPATTPTGALTLSGPSVQLTLLPGGRYELDNYNFTGSTDTLKMYGVDGVNTAFEFDGSNYVPIRTGMVTDTPNYIRNHKKQLMLGFLGSHQNSGINLPYVWTTVTGANEIGMGENITGYSVLRGDALLITSRISLNQLIGSSVDDFVLKPINPKHGAIPRTVQEMDHSYVLDDQGVIEIQPLGNYGNFTDTNISRRAQQVVDTVRKTVIASSVYRRRNQYRIYCSDGTGMILASGVDAQGNSTAQITQFDYNSGRTTNLINPTCVCSGKDATGKDQVYFGADNGYVYQTEKGTSFDGQAIEHYLRMPFGHVNTPRVVKHYRKVVLEMAGDGYTSISFHPEFSYGASYISTHQTQSLAVIGHGAYWGSLAAQWSKFFYDAQTVQTPEFKIGGDAVNLSMLFYGNSAYSANHILQGATIYYSPRRLTR